MSKNKTFTAPDGSNIYALIGQRIRRRRIALGMDPDSLAARLGVDAAVLAGIEDGAIRIRGPAIMAAIDALSTTRLYLLTGLEDADIERKTAELDRAIGLRALYRSLPPRRRAMLRDIMLKTLSA